VEIRRNLNLIPGKKWLELKPYKQLTSYDHYYIKLASRLLAEFKKLPPFLTPDTRMQNPTEVLALVLTSYLEDIVNEIGIWRAFTEANQKQLGYYLPFIEEDEEAYEPGVFDYRDLCYLIWHFLNQNEDTLFVPKSPMVESIADTAWNVLEPALEDAPETDFYREYLSLTEDMHFFEVKERLHWFGLKAYPLYFEFGPRLNTDYRDLIEKNKSFADQGEVLYHLMDEYAFSNPSTYCALTTPQWLGAVAGVSPEMGQQMFNLRYRLAGNFEYQSSTADHHIVRPVHHSEVVLVSKDSATIPSSTKKGDWILMALVSFQGKIMVSGMLAILGELSEREKQDLPPIPFPFSMKSEAEQTLSWEMIEEHEIDFRAEFGDLVYVPRDSADLQSHMKSFWIRSINRSNARQEKADASPPTPEKIARLMQHVPDAPDTATAFVPGEGMLFEPGAGRILQLLREPSLTDVKLIGKLFGGLVAELHPVVMDYFLQQVPDTPVWFPVKGIPYNTRPYLAFFSRYHQPENYLPRVPNVTVVKESEDS
jgi:Protein of unknown function (DUF3843)